MEQTLLFIYDIRKAHNKINVLAGIFIVILFLVLFCSLFIYSAIKIEHLLPSKLQCPNLK